MILKGNRKPKKSRTNHTQSRVSLLGIFFSSMFLGWEEKDWSQLKSYLPCVKRESGSPWDKSHSLFITWYFISICSKWGTRSSHSTGGDYTTMWTSGNGDQLLGAILEATNQKYYPVLSILLHQKFWHYFLKINSQRWIMGPNGM